MDIKNYKYQNMDIINYDDILYCLSYKWIVYLILNKKENQFIINKDLFLNCDLNIFNNKTLLHKVKTFFQWYLWKSIINKNDFMNFINQCYNYNWIDIRLYDKYFYKWICLYL